MALADAILRLNPPQLPQYLTQWTHGATPLSTTPVVTATIAGYLALIFGIREIMRSRPPLKLNFLFQIHNLFLTAISALLLTLVLEEILPHWYHNGFFSAICSAEAWTPRMEFYYMINYYVKYWELIDTVFLVFKKKPLAFLHVFHHAATALLCYTQLEGKTSVSWVVISINLAVHVLMYYYYYATAGGAKIWWKKHLTTFQIVQFVIDLFIVYFATINLPLPAYAYFASTYTSLPAPGTCSGTESAAMFGCGILTSYLILFILFYINTYIKKPSRSQKKGDVKMNGKVNGKANGKANGIAHEFKHEIDEIAHEIASGEMLDKLSTGQDPSVIDKLN